MAKPTGKQNKLAPVSFRLDPKVKFAAEIMARHQRRSLASTVEWALLRSMEGSVQVGTGDGASITLNELVNTTWNEDDFIRSVNVAFIVPHLATHEEACIRTVIMASAPLFFGKKKPLRHDLERVNFDALLLMRELVKERAEHLATLGELVPVSEQEWVAAYSQIVSQRPEALADVKEITKQDDIETLRLKFLHAVEYIIQLQGDIRTLGGKLQESETETAWNKLKLK
ncbi:hypothetical protein [Stutzerimonas nitrititolerans]|uniref:hypothetical protein n=1 Tax=Stutzerimonas nitrititolerans TaxID=2482751 RepID=UPI0028AD3550|nr:hypothetical protein [Stutzerimonas nitrititolerans]